MSLAVELWRALEAWDPDRHPRGPGGRFVKGLGGGGHKSLADAVKGTAEGGPKRQRKDGMSVADAVRKAARTSDTTGRPTQRSDAEHRAHGAHDVADEVDRALAEAGVSDSVRAAISGRARARADTHGLRPSTLGSAPKPAERQPATQAEVQGDIFDAVKAVQNRPGDWVGLADVRDRLGQHDRKAVDEALRGLLSHQGVRVIPVANLKALKPRDREAAVRIGGEDSHMMSIDLGTPRPEAPKPEAPTPSRSATVGDGLDRYRTSEDDYRKHFERYTDEQLADAGRVEGVPTEGRSRAGIVSALAAERAFQDRQTLERNLAERQAGSGAGSTQTRTPGVGSNPDRTEITGAWKGGRAPAPSVDAERRRQADLDARERSGGLGITDMQGITGKQAWGQLLAGPQKEQRAQGPKLSDAELAAERRKVLGRTAAATAGAPKRDNVFNNPEFNASTGRSTPALDEARAAHAETAARLADALRATKSRDDARAAIAALNVRELRGLAGHVGAKPGSKATKAKLIDAIVEMTAGRRLDSEAIGRL